MGLDSVELIMDIEKHFDISIPDIIAESLYAVQNVVDYVFVIKSIDQISNARIEKLKSDVITYLKKGLPSDFMIEQKTPISLFFPFQNRVKLWLKFQQDLDLKLPPLEKTDLHDWENEKSNLLRLFKPKLPPPLTGYNFSVLFNWVLMLNYDKFLPLSQAVNKQEIETAVIKLTSEKTGIPIHKIELHHSFTGDLGID